MPWMWRTVIVSLLTLAACAVPQTPPTTIPATATPVPPATTIATTTLEIGDCTTPPVTFSGLCEVFALLQEWHVDRPIDPATLAASATEALDDLTPAGARPGYLQCAAPDPTFEGFCRSLAEVAAGTGADIGEMVDTAVVRMVDAALGPYSYYTPPGEVPHVRDDGVVTGVGVVLDARDAAGSRCARLSPACPLTVLYVLEDGPGDVAGLLPGDVITIIDGESVDGEGFAATTRHLAGEERGRVRITVVRDTTTLDIVVDRQPLTGAFVEVDLPRPGVGYLRVPSFSEGIAELVHEGLDALMELSPEVIVVDLRDNAGGLIASAVAVASEFIGEGPIVHLNAPDGSHTETASGDGLAVLTDVVVLVNSGTASAAEVVAGALRDRRSALLVGTNTFGKDVVQIPFELRNGGQLHVVVATWTTPDGHTAVGGLSPDVEIELEMDLIYTEIVDVVIEATN